MLIEGARFRYGAAGLVWDNRRAMDERELQARRPDASADALALMEEPALAEALGSADSPRPPSPRPSPTERERGAGEAFTGTTAAEAAGEDPAYAGTTGQEEAEAAGEVPAYAGTTEAAAAAGEAFAYAGTTGQEAEAASAGTTEAAAETAGEASAYAGTLEPEDPEGDADAGFGAADELTLEDLLDIYATMLLTRTLDERVWAMNRQGKAAIVASSQGHEAAQLASVWALRKNAPDFFCFPYYRDLAVTTALGLTPLESLLGFLAKEGEPLSGARQFPQHGAAPQLRFINHSNVIGTHAPQAVGWALGVKMRGENTVTGCFFGDGTTSQGDVHEAMNFASIHKLAVVFFVENNKYAISVPMSRQMAIGRYAERAAGYAMPGVTVDGTDVRAAYQAASDAVRLAAMGGGPSVVEFDVERYLPHTSDDDDTVYRDRAEIEEARKRDPLGKLQRLLTAAGALTEERDAEMRRSARAEVDAATDAAEAAPFPGAGDLLRHVTAEAR